MDDPRCRFCSDPAVVRVALDEGCACFPDDREQCLCDQHWLKATPLGGMAILAVLGVSIVDESRTDRGPIMD